MKARHEPKSTNFISLFHSFTCFTDLFRTNKHSSDKFSLGTLSTERTNIWPDTNERAGILSPKGTGRSANNPKSTRPNRDFLYSFL